MEYKEIIDKIKPEMEKTISFLDRELSKIRTGQISPSLVEDVEVDCFDQKFILKQLAAITLGEGRQIIIQPWDKSYLEPIEKAISRSSLGVSPIVDKDLIRVSFPSPTQEDRKNLISILSEKKEEARRTIRHWREKAWAEIQDRAREGEIREDDKFRAKDDLQDLIDEHNKKIEEKTEKKKKEITQ